MFKLKDVRMRVSLWEKDKNGYSICLGEHFRLLESFQEISSNISRVTVIKKSLVPLAFDLTDENLNVRFIYFNLFLPMICRKILKIFLNSSILGLIFGDVLILIISKIVSYKQYYKFFSKFFSFRFFP